MKDQQKVPLMKKQQMLLLSSVIFILIISGGYFYYQYEKYATRRDKYSELKTIADLKISQIMHWREERLADAHVFSESPFVRHAIQRWPLSKDNTLEKDLLERLSLIRYNYKYENVFIVSAEGKILLSIDTHYHHIDSVTIDFCNKALRERITFFSDLYFCPTHNTIHFDIVAPISDTKNIPVAVLVLRVNPYDYLYPLIQSWPTSSKSAETLIIRKEGDSVLYVNELRHISNTALKLRIPLTSIETPAVQAVLGQTGICEGLDYRGVKVLADRRPIPGSPWFMIAKVDQGEIFSELYYRSVIVIIVTLILLLLLGVGMAWLYNNRQKNIYRELLETGTALQESQGEFRATLYSIGDAVITTDVKGCIRNMNGVAEKLTGWKESDAVGRSIVDVFHIVNEESRTKIENPVQRILKEGLVVGLANHTLLISKDGKEIPIADSGAPIRNEKNDITGVVLVFRDQTEERTAQKALQESERKFRETVTHLGEGYYSCMMDGVLLEHNQAFNRIFGFGIDQDLKGEKLPDFWQNPDERKVYLQELMTGGSIMNYLINAKTISGEKVVVMANSHLVKDEKSGLVRIEGTFTDFTERKRVEEALQESEERFRMAAETSNDVVYEWDLKQSVKWFGKIDEMLGYNPGEFPRTLDGLGASVHPEDWIRVMAAVQAHLEGGVPYAEEYRAIKKDGTFRRWSARGAVARTPEGEPVRWVGTVTDITERKRAEEAVKSSKAFLDTIVDMSPFAMWISDNEGTLIRANHSLCNTINLTDDMIIGKYNVLKDVNLEIQGVMPMVRAVFEKHEPARFSIPWKAADAGDVDFKGGRDMYIDVSMYPILNAQSELTNVVCQWIDITERKLAEETVRLSEQQLKSYIDNAGDAIYILEIATGRIRNCNARACHDLGYNLDELLKLSATDIEAILPSGKVAAIHHQLKSGEVRTIDGVHKRKDGTIFPVEIRLSSMAPVQPDLMVAMARDVTERKLTEEKLAVAQQLYQDLFANANIGILRSTPGSEGTFIDVNPAMVKMFEADSREQLMALHPSEIYWNASQRKILSDAIVAKGFAKEEIMYKTLKGKPLWCHINAVKKIDANGQVYLDSTIEDFTARKRAEEALRLKNFVFDDSIAANSIADINGVITEANAAFLRIWGYLGKHEVVGKSLTHFLNNLDEAESIVASLSNTSEWEGDYIARRKDGSTFIAHGLATVVKDENGKAIGYQSAVLDITERKQAEEKILGQLEELKRWQDVMIGREDRNRQLKHEVNELLVRLGETIRYPSQENDASKGKPKEV